MKPILIAAAVALAFLNGAARAAEIEFRPAYHLTDFPAYHLTDFGDPVATDEGDAAIRFGDFLNIDWKRLAEAHFTAYPLTGLSQTQIAELAAKSFYGIAFNGYVAPVTSEYGEAELVFLSADGSRPVTATGLTGTVAYELAGNSKTIGRVAHFGYVLGLPDPNNAPGGGFVAMLANGQELLSETIIGPENPALDAVSPLPELAVSRQIEYRFSGDEAAYLFVQYEADDDCKHGCCAFSYYLFRKDPASGALTELRFSQYACDV